MGGFIDDGYVRGVVEAQRFTGSLLDLLLEVPNTFFQNTVVLTAWSFGFDSQTRGTRENREPPCVMLKYRVPHGSQPRPGWTPNPLMVGIRSPDGLVVGLAAATLEFWVRFPNERNQGKQGATLS